MGYLRNAPPTCRKYARHTRRVSFLYSLMLALALLLSPGARADTISGTVKDPSAAVVAGASIEITGDSLAQPLVLVSDANGKFEAPNLKAGKYSIRVSKEGFDDLTTAVDLNGTAEVPFSLTITAQQTSVTVTGKSLALANSSAAYRQLRDVGLGDTFHCDNFTLAMDVATFQLKSGTITLLQPINGSQTGAIFVGQGHFTLKPLTTIDAREMTRRAGGPDLEEDISEVVFRFTPGELAQLSAGFGPKAQTPPEAAAVFQHWREKVRHRHE